MKIKFNHIQDLSDARYAAAAMAEWIGFTVGDLPISQVQEIIGWCAGPKLTLELPHRDLKDMAISWCNILPVEAIECPAEDHEFWQSCLPNPNVEWLLLNQTIATVSNSEKTQIFLVDPQSTSADTIKNFNHDAISLNCEKETIVGMKNYDLWNDLLETLEIW